MPAIIRNWSAITSISLSLLCAALQGCSSASPNVIPATGPDTLAVYMNHTEGGQPDAVKRSETVVDADNGEVSVRGGRQLLDKERDLAGYTRNAANEIDALFPRLPNPELVIYVFPHINGKGRPIPGYSTSFLMYEKDEYALPGEVAP